MLCSGINTDTIYYSISRCPRTSEFFFSILKPQSLLIRMHSTKSSDTTTWQDLRCPNLRPPTPHNICIFDVTLKLVCSFFFSSHPMISWQLEPKKTHIIHPSETSIYTLDIVTLLHLPGRSCSGRRNRRHLTSHGTVAAAPRTAKTTSFYFAGPPVAAGSSSDEIFLQRSQQSGLEVWMKQRDSWEDTFFAYCEYWEDTFFEYCVHWCKNWEALPGRRVYCTGLYHDSVISFWSFTL